MELVLNSSINEHLVDENEIINKPSSSFIEANTEIVSFGPANFTRIKS
jgi:hypothetical protein